MKKLHILFELRHARQLNKHDI